MVPALISVAFITLLERKILGLVGYRLGPFKSSFLGTFQPIADALKLLNKQNNLLSGFSFFFYFFSSSLMLFSSFFLFFVLPYDPSFLEVKYVLLFLFLVLGFNRLNSIFIGWRVFRKYSLIGRIRTVSQLISYEGVLYLCLIFLVFFRGGLDNLSFFFFYPFFLFFLLPVCGYIWIPTFLAELNRTPYDFSEGERELVRGFNTEFGGSCFTFIFLGEYGRIFFFSIFRSILFFSLPMGFVFFLFFVIWIRSVLPRFRFDKLMSLSWKFFIPFLTVYLVCFIFSSF